MSRPVAVIRKVLLTAAAAGGFALLISIAPFGALAGRSSEAPPAEAARAVDRAIAKPVARAPEPSPVPTLGCGDVQGTACPSSPSDVLGGIGLAGFEIVPEDSPPRDKPVPPIPGCTEIARFRGPGLTLFLDRPRDPDLALELTALAFHQAGWRPVGGSTVHQRPSTGAVYARGGEVAVVTLEESIDPLLLVAYHGDASALEDVP